MGSEVLSCLFLILPRGGVEYRSESGERCSGAAGSGHNAGREYSGVVELCYSSTVGYLGEV
jgi:hypothetical protein